MKSDIFSNMKGLIGVNPKPGILFICFLFVYTCIQSQAQDYTLIPDEVTAQSAHAAHSKQLALEGEIITEDMLEIQALEKRQGKLFPAKDSGMAQKTAEPKIDPDCRVFAYLQSENIVFHVRWHALTDIGSLFVNFDTDGNFTNQSSRWDNRSSYMRSGGAAEAAGIPMNRESP